MCVSKALVSGGTCDWYGNTGSAPPLSQALHLRVQVQYSDTLGDGFVILWFKNQRPGLHSGQAF